LRANAVAMQLPIGCESDFRGVVDLMKKKAYIWHTDDLGKTYDEQEIPTEMDSLVKKWQAEMLEKIVETDDALLEKFLSGVEPSVEELKKALRAATIAGKIYPVFAGSALKNKGIQPLLDAVVDYLPSPLDIPPVEGTKPRSEEKIIRRASDDEPFCALAFKIVTDPYVGKLCFFRVYSGTLKAGSYVLNSTTGEKERIGRIVRLYANHREEVEEVFTGDIAAAVGLKNTFTGHTLCDPANPIVLESISFPDPVISVAIEPKTKADQEKMGLALGKLAEEDPTFKIRTDEETAQTIIAGMGELHLEIIIDRMKREFKVEANVGKPQVAYKETVRKIAEAQGKYIHQSGGRGQYGDCWIRVEPQERGKGFEFIDEIKGGIIPREYIPAIEKGVKEAMANGVVAGYPLVDMRVAVYDGSYHEVDSSEIAFKIAGNRALQEATKRADPVLLEPIMRVEVVMPEQFMGEVIGDLNSRRGQIEKMSERGQGIAKVKIIDAKVPLSEMFGYATILRSMTQGRASYTMEFLNYQEVPRNVAELIIEGKK